MTLPSIVVVAAVIERDDRLLVSRRLKGTHLEDLWEFPGGKCEPGETHEQSLARELQEELGVTAQIGDQLLVTAHAYPDRIVTLHFMRCAIEEEPRAMLGQQIRWVTREELRLLDFPAADKDLIALLTRERPSAGES